MVRMSASATPAIAETTQTTAWSRRWAATMRAAAHMRSVPASDVPPNFTTITTLLLLCETSRVTPIASERARLPNNTKGHSHHVTGSGRTQTARRDSRRVRGGQLVWPQQTGPGPPRPSPFAALLVEQACVVAPVFNCSGDDSFQSLTNC